MSNPLPPAGDFTKEPMSALDLSDALVRLRDHLAGLLGTSGVPADALASLGALFGGVVSVSGTRTMTAADRGRALVCTGTFTMTLPSAAVAGAGWACLVANTGTGVVTLARAGSDQIDGATSATLGRGRAVLLIGTGSAWRSFALPGTAGGPTHLADGTTAAPGLTFAADIDTGLFRPAADVLAVATGGAERLRVTNAGAEVTGLLSGTALTQSAQDDTAGRVVRIQDADGRFARRHLVPRSGAVASGQQTILLLGPRNVFPGFRCHGRFALRPHIGAAPGPTPMIEVVAYGRSNNDHSRLSFVAHNTDTVSMTAIEPVTCTFGGQTWVGIRMAPTTNALSDPNAEFWFTGMHTNFGQLQLVNISEVSSVAPHAPGADSTAPELQFSGQAVYHRGNIVGTVAQSGGVPTQDIIERGSGSAGEFVRFADGTQICTRRQTVDLAISTGFLGGFRSPVVTWNYPAVFVAPPALVVTPENLTAFGGVSSNSPGASSATWLLTAVTSQGSASRSVALAAFGRWF